MRRLSLSEEQQFFDTVKELVHLGLEIITDPHPVAGASAARAIESTTGKRSGFTVGDVLIAINEEARIARPTQVIFPPLARS